MKNTTILVIEDDLAITKMLKIALAQYGYQVMSVTTKKEAKRALNTSPISIILLDLGLPDGDGKTLIKEIRSLSAIPIIVVSARYDEQEIITSLDFGADDYLTKPFSITELLARIRSNLRRNRILPNKNNIICADLNLDLSSTLLFYKEKQLSLTPTEFNLLRYLMLNPNRVLTKQQILKEVWGIGYQNEMQYLRTYISLLRKKIELDPAHPQYILTASNFGYRFICNTTV